MLRRLARPVARRSGAGAAQAPNRARVRWAQAGRRRVVPGGPGGGGERRQAPPGRHAREQARALRGIREADELRRRGQLRHLHRRDNRREGAPEPKDGRRESLPEEETGVMEADLPDDRREQGEFRQGRRPTAAPVEEMIEQSFMHIRWTDSMRCDPVPCTSVRQRCVSRQQVTDNLHVQLLFTPKMNRRGTLLLPLLASVTNLFLANP